MTYFSAIYAKTISMHLKDDEKGNIAISTLEKILFTYIFYVTDKLINQTWIIGLIFQDRARISQMAFVQGQVFTGRNYRTNNSFQ